MRLLIALFAALTASPLAAQPSTLTVKEEVALKAGDTFKECSECPLMVVVPTGSFTMGAPPEPGFGGDAKSPQHKVTIAQAFAVGKFEVTFAEWDACVADRVCRHRPKDEGWGRGSRPVFNVSWDDITQQYLFWLSRKSDKIYRLLSEAEWEYVARAGTTTRFHFGDTEKDLCTYANVPEKVRDLTDCRQGYGHTAPVGSFRPNAFGLHDMLGNVWELVQDCWHYTYEGAPADGTAWTVGYCNERVLRGGAWISPPGDLGSAVRGRLTPGNRNNYTGFRVARTLCPAPPFDCVQSR
jgi:formylglycine-generating enzyme required for sulfatase activity